jgi:hypothetical protein
MSELLSGSFFDAWDTYQKVVAGDYMFHREIGVEMNRVLRARFDARPFPRFGLRRCRRPRALAGGVANPAIQGRGLVGRGKSESPALPGGTHPCAYFGRVDRRRFLRRDLQQFRLAPFAYRTKGGIFQRAAQRLHKGGLLLLVDVLREEDETLEVYHKRYCGWLRSNFSALNGDEKDLICDHIVNNDLPEPRSVLEAQAQAAGPGSLYIAPAMAGTGSCASRQHKRFAKPSRKTMTPAPAERSRSNASLESIIPNCADPPRRH